MVLLREHMLMKGKGNSNNILCKEYDEMEYDYLSIDILKKYFHHEVSENTDTNYNVDNLVNDFIFLCFLIGNDFLPNMNCIEIGLGGLDKLLEIYYDLLKVEKEHLVLNKKINVHFLRKVYSKNYLKMKNIFLAIIFNKEKRNIIECNINLIQTCQKKKISLKKFYTILNV